MGVDSYGGGGVGGGSGVGGGGGGGGMSEDVHSGEKDAVGW